MAMIVADTSLCKIPSANISVPYHEPNHNARILYKMLIAIRMSKNPSVANRLCGLYAINAIHFTNGLMMLNNGSVVMKAAIARRIKPKTALNPST
jgi:hypothetical protein